MTTSGNPSETPAAAPATVPGRLTLIEKLILHSQYALVILMVLLAVALRIIYGAP